jgi:hypothetical protein
MCLSLVIQPLKLKCTVSGSLLNLVTSDICTVSVHHLLSAALRTVVPSADEHTIAYASAVSRGHYVGKFVKITTIMQQLFNAALGLVNRCHTVGGQKSTIIYIVIKGGFWPPARALSYSKSPPQNT